MVKPMLWIVECLFKPHVNECGQVFSPDILIAVVIFLAALVFFYMGSNSIFAQEDLFELRSEADEVLHATMNSLVFSQGKPVNWDEDVVQNVSFFGLADERNIVDQNKIVTLINFLDNNYLYTKERLGIGKFSFKLRVIDFNGSVLYSSTRTFTNTRLEQGLRRIVSLNGTQVTLEGVVAFER